MLGWLLVVAVILLASLELSRDLRRLTGAVRHLAPGCTCPTDGSVDDECPAHGEEPDKPAPARQPAPPPDSTDAFYVPPGRNE